MGVVLGEVLVVECDEAVFFFCGVKVFDDAFFDEFFPFDLSVFEVMEVLVCEFWLSIFDDDEGSARSSPSGVKMNFVEVLIIKKVEFKGECSSSAFCSELFDKVPWVCCCSGVFVVDVDVCHCVSLSPMPSRDFLSFSSATSPREMLVMSARFFLSPMLVPSGVSIGHNLPI